MIIDDVWIVYNIREIVLMDFDKSLDKVRMGWSDG
jgi:hypothetical protein